MAEQAQAPQGFQGTMPDLEQPTGDQLAQIGELIRGEADAEHDKNLDPGIGPGEDGDGEPKPAEPKDDDQKRGIGPVDLEGLESLNQLAERLGIDQGELYKLALPLKGDRSLTLGEAKDMLQEPFEVASAREEVEQMQADVRKEIMTSRAEMQNVINLLGGANALPKELVAYAQQQHTETMNRELNALLGVLPEWKDDNKFRQAKDDIYELVSTYGFNRQEVEMVFDSRLHVMLNDFAQLTKKLAAAKGTAERDVIRDGDNTRRPQRTPAADASPTMTADQINEARSKGAGAQVGLISKILQGEQK